MKIENVQTHLVRLPFSSGGPAAGPTAWSTLDYVLVRIDTDDGLTGWGDGFGYRVPEATRAVLDHTLGPRLVGRDARDVSGINHALQVENHLWGRYGITLFAISAIDIALWDLAGKAAGLPLHRLLGGPRRLSVPCYASLFRYGDPALVAEHARRALADGFRHVKLHEIGETEVHTARQVLCGDAQLMVDTNCPWNPRDAARMAERFAAYDLYWLEEPVFPPEDFRSLAEIQATTGVRLAAGENLCTAFQFQAMFEAGAVTYAQPSVTKVGGVTEMSKIVALAEAHGIAVVPHCPYFGPGLLASLHVLATLPDEALGEFFYYETLEASLYGDAIVPVDGALRVPQGPGLGLDPDPDVIREYGS
jgi:L-alanine-DL-glutamate epimerase-like enolase superfamily enzyme